MGRKKTVAIDDDEYSFPEDLQQQQQQPLPTQDTGTEIRTAANSRKGKKGSKNQRDVAADGQPAEDWEKSSSAGAAEPSREDDDDAVTLVFSGKKKSSKSKKSSAVTRQLGGCGFKEATEKEKKKKGGRIAQEEDFDQLLAELGEAPAMAQTLTPSAVLDEMDGNGDLDVELSHQGSLADPDLKKQNKKKKKKSGRTAQEEDDLDKLLTELGEAPPLVSASTSSPPTLAEEEVEGDEVKDADLESNRQVNGAEEAVSKKQQKKKKKKSGRTAQEEEALDKILAELGEGQLPPPPSAAPPHQSALVVQESASAPVEQPEAEDRDGEAEGESAAAKKKKKKKEKEKEKKAAAAAAAAVVEVKEEKVEVKGKVPDKKLPKHVREMQEALARRKEAEERKKREEEERLRKEEEERKRLEELERLAEEAKRRKKDREKEKLLKKKQEGKLLTAKQKDEQRRLEAMRKQFLAQSEVSIGDSGVVIKKRPKYETKKSKLTQSKVVETEKVTENEQVVDEPCTEQAVQDVMVEEESQSQVGDSDDKTEADQEPEEVKAMDEDEDDEEWDAKSWDDLDVTLPATNPFAEEDQDIMTKPKGTIEHVSFPVESQANSTAPAKPDVKKVAAPRTSSKKNDANNKEDEHESESATNVKRGKEAIIKQESTAVEDKSKKSGPDLRSPICCILGHVDTGKTKLLDCIRRTNVQEGEAGGITQQIGATYFPTENIRERTRELKADATLKVPGLLVIDTPGHESFTNLRSRGSSLCDIAILVVDIMHGLEPQTIESINLLKSRNAEFIVALNKVDRLYGWKSCPNAPIVKALRQQSNDVKNEFNMRLTQIITQFKEQGLNTALYYKNKEMGETFNIVPTSAISGEGIADLLLLLVQWAQKTMEEKLTFVDEVQCTVLEVKVIEGLGTTIDVVLVNGVLHEGDQIVVCGMQGPIVTNIRALLTPHPMKELRVKGSYLHHKELKAAQGVKISAQGLEHAIAGTSLYVAKPEDDLEDLKKTVMQDVEKIGTPICIPSREFIDIGKIASIEINHKQVDVATKGQKVAIKSFTFASLDENLVDTVLRSSLASALQPCLGYQGTHWTLHSNFTLGGTQPPYADDQGFHPMQNSMHARKTHLCGTMALPCPWPYYPSLRLCIPFLPDQ
ncbi:hypothetical protein C4D60_Mb04t25690 [Musa balbisiana]|uniref:Tr-type G domain-containing protein n=1 Tax=Musa balbisiana TaxID=52838 RepID=A0A4S8KEN9_MUSBA|nr:hypothetical protein C4D60_Mb04t25690 [Musa balbisiana]